MVPIDDPLIDPEDLDIKSYSPIPPGGQHVGVSPGVSVEHAPSGTIAIVQIHRSMHRNKAIAIRMIEAALADPEFR